MKSTKVILAVLVLIIFAIIDASAQCPMCKMAAESNLDHGGTAGQGLNTGILYMLMMPYLLVAIIGYIWYRNRKTDVDLLEDQLNTTTVS